MPDKQQPMPVTVLPGLAVLGPGGARPGEWHEELVRRVALWHRADGAPGPAARPGRGPGTAGAPLRETVRELLARSPQDGAAVVHRASRSVSRVTLAGPGRPQWSGIRTLGDRLTDTRADPEDLLRSAAPLLEPWSGLLVTTRRLLDRRGPLDRRPHLHHVLDGLRSLAPAPYPGCGPAPPGPSVGAAGPSERHWLLDGALALLSRRAAVRRVVEAGVPGSGRGVVVGRIPGLPGGWRIVRLLDRASGAPPTAAWGADACGALRHARAAAATRAGRSGSLSGPSSNSRPRGGGIDGSSCHAVCCRIRGVVGRFGAMDSFCVVSGKGARHELRPLKPGDPLNARPQEKRGCWPTADEPTANTFFRPAHRPDSRRN
ncbi:hypothetical protein ACIQWA_03405 [Kitasatospora sp. NPDC098652]|uniref:hypothetical protein n=1 Tax=Kitasatospora sp. NPDC098652 TaxID=3364095 RepID=UPI00382BE338